MMDFSGAVTATIGVTRGNSSGFRGLDYVIGSAPEQDRLVMTWTNRNGIDVVGGGEVLTGAGAFEGGGIRTTTTTRFGVHVARYACDDPRRSLVFWTTMGGDALQLRQWSPSTLLRRVVLPTTGARGVTRTPRRRLLRRRRRQRPHHALGFDGGAHRLVRCACRSTRRSLVRRVMAVR